MHPDAPEVDHIVPKSRGGTDDEANLRCAHRRCNQKKLSFLDEELRTAFGSNGEILDAVAVMEATVRLREGGRKGAQRLHELYPNLSSKIGRQTGRKVMLKLHAERPELFIQASKKGGKIGGRRKHELYPTLAREWGLNTDRKVSSKGGLHNYELHSTLVCKTLSLGRHTRWHTRRGIVNLSCELCCAH